MARRSHTSPQTLALLGTLLDSGSEWRHGYELSRATGLRSGTLYPMLARLTQEGWLEARWTEPERSGRPPRHVYRLTPEGRAQASDRLAATSAARVPAS